MKLIIDVPDELAKKEHWYTDKEMWTVIKAAQNGTPIPDNATVGEVFCMLACKEPICETASYFTIDKNLWNSPYQKGGKK